MTTEGKFVITVAATIVGSLAAEWARRKIWQDQ